MLLTNLDIVVLIIYFAGMISVGFYPTRRAQPIRSHSFCCSRRYLRRG
jgi:hypothetical protein